MSVALGRLAEEDPTFQVQTNEETGQTEISGMGELHLEILVDRMKREYGVEANVGAPAGLLPRDDPRHGAQDRGPLRQADRRLGPVRHRLHRHRAGPRRGLRLRLEDQGRLRAEEFIPAVEKGCEEALATGVKAGYPMVDVTSRSIDGKYHDTDSSEIAFKVAGSLALKEAAKRAKPVLLEPVFAVEVTAPRTTSARSSATSSAVAATSRARSVAATRSS